MRYDPGVTIIQQGEPAEKFYIITKGQVEVLNHRTGGQDVVLGELGTGEWFGEIGLLLDRPRTATVRAKLDSEVQLMAMNKESFSRLLAKSPAPERIWRWLCVNELPLRSRNSTQSSASLVD